MRPSSYHYLKRMWIRNLNRRGCCFTSFLLFPFRLLWVVIKAAVILALLLVMICFFIFIIPAITLAYLLYVFIKYLITKSVEFKMPHPLCTLWGKAKILADNILDTFKIKEEAHLDSEEEPQTFNQIDKKEKPEAHKNNSLSGEELERFMIACSAYIERQEAMRQYEEYYNIEHDDNDDQD